MEELDVARQLTARAIAAGADEAGAARIAAQLAPVLSCLQSADDDALCTVEPALLFRPDALTPASGAS